MSAAAGRLNPLRWLGLPLLLCLAATILFGLPLRLFGFGLPEPVFGMVLAFAWAVIRPSLLAPFALLLVGLFQDIFWGGALGLWPLALLFAYGLVLATRNMMAGQGRAMTWFWFAMACFGAEMIAYLATQMDARAAPNLLAVLWQLLATILLYPFADRLIEQFEDADVRFR